jgi:hypothetical protein
LVWEGRVGKKAEQISTKNTKTSQVPVWLMSVILATHKAEIRRIMIQSQPGQIAHKTVS